MTRPYRIQIENGIYHITSRGNEKRPLFVDTVDFNKFLEYVMKAKEKYNFYVYAYVFMSTHYHLLIETPQANLSQLMQYLNTSYTNYFNWKHKRQGHLFQGRYKSLLIDSETYFIRLMRYIHLNPVNAKMVESPKDYEWSSYSFELGGKGGELIDRDQRRVYMDMGKQSYVAYVEAGIGKDDKLFDRIFIRKCEVY